MLLCAAGVYYMVLLGGYTRLTHSGINYSYILKKKLNNKNKNKSLGLSMTRWRPIEYTYPTTEQ